ncbi:N-acetylneuraminate synthase [Catenuloplanes nepalensis]|uniref:N-acetylneuraminate synthase n=1 Tax=Catenuloplanes nepalensis TaxID=587533 RepID=A0ABT9N272_9ACTN|nr:pseudaminic acid synthase [Catenuloplanes nepalensis]MDP9797802.1 N-acetylneuraminate synthase [Catenuloplanes nepalensis]
MTDRQTRIDHQYVGTAHPPFVIAEMSGNHNGDLQRALRIVDAIADAGASALKIQTYRADTLTIDVDGPRFRISDGHELWGGENLYRLYERAHTPWEWHEPIFDRARERGLIAFSSPFDPTAVDLLEKLNAPAYKIASSELVDLPLIRLAASTGKPLIMSTGMANVAEIDAAVRAARGAGCANPILLSCTATYPAPVEAANLRRIPVLADAFGTIAGLSDHTPGIGVAVASVALGAAVIEKHVTLSRAEGGVDAEFSLEPAELAALVVEARRAHAALGSPRIGADQSEEEGLRYRRSLYVVEDVAAGDTVTRDNVRSIRPAGGLPPGDIDLVLGRVFRSAYPKGTPLTWDIV